jgi:trafficking protein particle complex subunit 11
MEAYPKDYVEHNLPLIVLSGLQAQSDISKDAPEQSLNPLLEGGFRIRTDAVPLTGSTAESILRAFLAADSSGASWNGRATPSKTENGVSFRIKSVGRVGQTPISALLAAFFQSSDCITLHPRELTE